MTRQELARVALRSAFEARQKADTPLNDPICIFDFVEKLGARVWFVGGASFAGIYAKGHRQVFVPAERPAGRKAYTCAHEFAHWWFKHGTRVEELDFDRSDNEVPEEILANLFAAFLLMPRHAVLDTFKRRKLEPRDADPLDFYTVACQLGVGYETLIKHMRWSLDLIGNARMRDLQSLPPKEIRRAVLGYASSGHLVLTDSQWTKVAIDLEVGDLAVVPRGVILKGQSAKVVGECFYGRIVEGIQPGLTQALVDGGEWAAMVRVCRKQFTGIGTYRHLEESNDETD
jgi:hypothetical protein